MNIKQLLEQHPSTRYSEDMQTVCRPLKRLQIDYFAHAHFDDNGEFVCNSSNPRFFTEYFRQGFYNYDFHLGEIAKTQRYVLWDFMSLKGETKALYELGLNFGVKHIFTIIDKVDNKINCYHFAAKSGRDYMICLRILLNITKRNYY